MNRILRLLERLPVVGAAVSQPSLRGRIARGAFWIVTGAAINRLFGLIASVLVARIMGRDSFGQLGIIQSTVLMFQICAGMGLGLTAVKYVSEWKKKDPRKTGRIISFSVLVAVVAGSAVTLAVFLFAPALCSTWLAAPTLARSMRIACVILFFGALNAVQIGIISGFEVFNRYAAIQVITGVTQLLLTVAGAMIAGVEGAVAGYAVNQLICCILCRRTIQKCLDEYRIPGGFRGCLAERDIWFRYSLPALLANLLVWPIFWICNAMLVNTPNGYAEMGVFNAANQWKIAVLFLPSLIGQVVLPVLSEQNALQNYRVVRSILLKTFLAYALLATPIVLVTCLFSPFIMGCYGSDFRGSWPAFIFLQFAVFIQVLTAPGVKFLEAGGRMWVNFYLNIGWSGILLLITHSLVRNGALGLAQAQLIAMLVFAVGLYVFCIIASRRQSADSNRFHAVPSAL